MDRRAFRVVKRTPIALAFCDACNMEFQSLQRIEDDAEREMRTLFDAHQCRAQNAAPGQLIPVQKAAGKP